jgi:hypothetical protein
MHEPGDDLHRGKALPEVRHVDDVHVAQKAMTSRRVRVTRSTPGM